MNTLSACESKQVFDEFGQTYIAELSDGSISELIPRGADTKVQFDDRHEYIKMYVKARTKEIDYQIAAVRRGICKIIPDSLIKCNFTISLIMFSTNL